MLTVTHIAYLLGSRLEDRVMSGGSLFGTMETQSSNPSHISRNAGRMWLFNPERSGSGYRMPPSRSRSICGSGVLDGRLP
jgi:hypothetical protein